MRAASGSLAILLLSTVALPSLAAAQTTSDELRMYSGPGDRFPVVTTVSRDNLLDVRGCVENFRWCDVVWQNSRGWVSAERVMYPFEGRAASVAELRERLDIPVVGFSFGTYWDDFYRDQPWYGEREHWQSMWRDQPNYLHFGRSGRATQSAGRVPTEENPQGQLPQTQMDRGADQNQANDGRAGNGGDRTGMGPGGGEQGREAGNNADRGSQNNATGPTGSGTRLPDRANGATGPGGSRDGGPVGGSGSRSVGAGSSSSSGSSGGSSGSGGSSSGGGGGGGGG